MQKVIRGLIVFAFAVAGYLLGSYTLSVFTMISTAVRTAALIAAPVLFGLIGFLVAPGLQKLIAHSTEAMLARLSAVPLKYVLCTVLGLILGLVIAALIGTAFSGIGALGSYLSLLLIICLGYIGARIGYKKADDIAAVASRLRGALYERVEKQDKGDRSKKNGGRLTPKLLDTSVIIDGRIADIYRTGFIEGELIIPAFVLDELRHVADSSDALKRNRGRRGLDVLNKLRGEFGERVTISDRDFPELAEVDSKLLRLAEVLHGVVLTNDYNLNKVAKFQGVTVLNINELSNAVKPVVLPGEEMTVTIVKEGKEQAQGVAYLDDGTMIVVENGSSLMGRSVVTVVTGVLQTAAGKMIFSRPKLDEAGRAVSTEEGAKD